MRNKLKYFFASKKLLKAQAVDCQRQLQEAWDELDVYKNIEWGNDFLRDQLHRVARERDEERRLRLMQKSIVIEGTLDILENEEE